MTFWLLVGVMAVLVGCGRGVGFADEAGAMLSGGQSSGDGGGDEHGDEHGDGSFGGGRTIDEVERESAGRLRELRETREQLRELKERLAQLEQQQTAVPKTENETDQEEERLATVSDVKALREQLKKELQQEQQAAAEAAARKRVAASEEAMIAKTRDYPEGLDYESVIRTAYEDLSQRDLKKIHSSDNPAQVAYDLCIQRNQELRELHEAMQRRSRRGSLLDGLPRRSTSRVSADDEGGLSLTPDDIDGMSDAELERLERRLGLRGRTR